MQEAQAKRQAPELLTAQPRWHLLGHLQSNKARPAVDLFAIIQTLDRPRLATVLARHAEARGTRLQVLLEVDYTGLPERTGLAPAAVYPTVETLLGLSALDVVGLMTVPAPGLAASEIRAVFRRLAALQRELARQYPSLSWHHLSMGMTDDFEVAIEEGATIVRVGSILFDGPG